MEHKQPRVCIGLPVYNGEDVLPRAVDSFLAQTYRDIGIVIADNASTDRTQAICEAYARQDPRVRYHRNETNLGQIANFNRVFELSRCEYFRWAGCNDWLAPGYVERCVEALDGNPDAILASCEHEFVTPGGEHIRDPHTGARVDSPYPHRRFARMLWFLKASRYYFDPIYSMMRRSVLEKTAVLRPIFATDLALAAELSLAGPCCHVPEYLVYQSVTAPAPTATLMKRYDPRLEGSRRWFGELCRVMAGMIRTAPMTRWQKGYCFGALAKYAAKHHGRAVWAGARRTVALRTRLRSLKAAVMPKTSPSAGGHE